MDNYSNTFNKEPKFNCPICNTELFTDRVDNGFGAFSVQVSPYICESCGWSETGCERCIKERCFSWEKCRGRALVVKKLDPISILKWIAGCPYNVDEATVSKLGIDATPPYQAVMNISLSYTVWKQLQDFVKQLPEDGTR